MNDKNVALRVERDARRAAENSTPGGSLKDLGDRDVGKRSRCHLRASACRQQRKRDFLLVAREVALSDGILARPAPSDLHQVPLALVQFCPIIAALSRMNGHHCPSLPPHPTRPTPLSSVQIANPTSMSLAREMALLIEQNADRRFWRRPKSRTLNAEDYPYCRSALLRIIARSCRSVHRLPVWHR